jgi:protein involved in polysaccharide export with SLBB domain/glycosyltransferase involved in cell wall biosynthesis
MNHSRKYRVAMVAACPFPSLRGSQVLIRELAESLANAGHSVHVVTYPTAQHMVPIQRIAIHRVAKLPGLWTARPFGWQKLVLDLLLLWKVLRVVRREKIDVIHAHNFEAPLISYVVRFLTGVPVVYHAHNALSDELPCYFNRSATRRAAARLGAFLDRWVSGWANYSIALSDRLAAFLAVRGGSGRVDVIPPAITPLMNGRRPRVRANRGFVIMYAGNLDPYQDIGLLLAGFERVSSAEPSARLVFVTHQGAHPETQQRAAALARRPGVTVRVVNTFTAAVRELSEADVVVCPRNSWSGFPIKVLNYMALGSAIVHARASAHSLTDGTTALLFSDNDPIALARSILRLRDPALAQRLGRQARAVVLDQYTWPRLLPRIVSVYDRIVPEGPEEEAGELEGSKQEDMKETAVRPIRDRAGSRHGTNWARGLQLLVGTLLFTTLSACGPKPEPAPLPPLQGPGELGMAQLDTQYRFQAGDTVRVKFLYHPELDVKAQVRPDGSLNIQGVGEVLAQGKTAEELEKNIVELSSDHLRDPEVTVLLAGLGQRAVYVGGEVRIPGPVPFRDGLTPLQAILDRGGFTEVARTDSVLHLSIKENTYQATRLDLRQNLKHGAPELGTLAVYDVIYVPRTFIGDANAFVRLYIRGLIPAIPRVGVGLTP